MGRKREARGREVGVRGEGSRGWGPPCPSPPNRWSFSYLKFTKYVTNIIDEPKYKYGQQEQATARNHNRSTALERSV